MFSGVAGALIAVGSIIDLFENFNTKAFILLTLMLIISIFLIFCGLKLFFNRSNLTFVLNFFSQVIQIISITLGGFHFMFFFGLPVYCSLESFGEVEFKFGAGLSKLSIATGLEPNHFSFSINLIAVVLTLWFWEQWKREQS